VQSKGADPGKAKKWVDRMRSEREAQEDRRILYVAATRAREELHLFARPAYSVASNGDLALAGVKKSLLATAWPALEDRVRARFAEWQAESARHEPVPATIDAIAAAAQPVEMPAPARGTTLRRLPADYKPRQAGAVLPAQPEASIVASGSQLYRRHEGGLLSRLAGIALHRFMEELARLRVQMEWEPARSRLGQLVPRVEAELRGAGLDAKQAAALAADALAHALRASHHPTGQWILSPHAEAASEVRWAGVIEGNLRTVQADRVFRAGEAPHADEDGCWWIVDYKSHGAERGSDPATELPRLREVFAPQLEAYAAVLKNLRGSGVRIFAGLYYPRVLLFDWWEA